MTGQGAATDEMHAESHFREICSGFFFLLFEKLHAHLCHRIKVGQHSGRLIGGITLYRSRPDGHNADVLWNSDARGLGGSNHSHGSAQGSGDHGSWAEVFCGSENILEVGRD